ncbi:hypothetical protein GGR51DRAFT_286543 [Nemania sp. FL0031]|nr:hypothetical protein GGR51DRAFT_286543 [Nemania sp. FL0031]
MEDLRDAEKTVSEFARLIDRLRPDGKTSYTEERHDLLDGRHDSNGSHKSNKSSMSSRWRPRNLKREWDETVEGILWNELEQSQNRVASKFKIDQTALKEYISSPEMMDLGCEFARHYFGDPAREKSYWAAEDLFFELQAIKQGDTDAARWAEAKVYKKEWELADHLVRFVLLAEQCRLCSGQEKWVDWQWNFHVNVCFYLSVLRCYTFRDAKQRELARRSVGSPLCLSPAHRDSKHSQSPSTPRCEPEGVRAQE